MSSDIHVTAASIIESRGRFLLVEERVDGRVVLNQPAGHLDPGESLATAAARETFEETGYTFAPTHLVGIYHWQNETGTTFVRFAFCGTAGDPVPGRTLDSPVVRTLWMTFDEIVAATDRLRGPLVLQCIADHRAGRRLPLDAIYTHPSVAAPDAGSATSEP